MDSATTYPKYACQFCGSTRKLVETLIDDEFTWNDDKNHYEPNKFADEFEHTGGERCANCKREWTGARETAGLLRFPSLM